MRASAPLHCAQVVLYSLPELDGAIDTVVLGGLVGDRIALVPERVRKMNQRLKGWITLRRTPPQDRKIAVLLYGFPPNVGAVSHRLLRFCAFGADQVQRHRGPCHATCTETPACYIRFPFHELKESGGQRERERERRGLAMRVSVDALGKDERAFS